MNDRITNENNNKTDMKKYIKPCINEKSVELQSMIAGSLALNDKETEAPQLSSSRRGNWGNLWDDED